MSSKTKSDTTEDNLNTVSTYRRYNLRSSNKSKAPVQLNSKAGRSLNNHTERFINQNAKVCKKKTTVSVGLNIRETNSAKIVPANKSCTLKKNAFIKSQVPKYAPPPVTNKEYKCNKPEKSGVQITNTVIPCKSTLKRIQERKPLLKNPNLTLLGKKSPLKNPNLTLLDEKNIIKERIYGKTVLKQSNHKLKTVSCNNLELMSYENNASTDIKVSIQKSDELNVSVVENKNNEKEIFSDVNPDNKACDATEKVYLALENQKDVSSGNFLQSEAENCEIHANTEIISLPLERINLYPQIFKNKCKISGENSPKLELPCRNFAEISHADNKTQVESISNERQSCNEKLIDSDVNSTLAKIENLRILKDVQTSKRSPENKKLQEKITQRNLDTYDLAYGDQHTTFNYTDESVFNNKDEECYNSKPSFDEDKTENITMSLTPRSPDQKLEDYIEMKHKKSLKKEVDERIKNLTSKFSQEINRKRKRKNKSMSLKDCSVLYYDKCNGTQTKFSSEKKQNKMPIKEKKRFLTYTANMSGAEELDISQKECSFSQELKLDLNQSDRSPETSKIPRLMQNLDKDFSPPSKMCIIPTKIKRIIDDGSMHTQNEKNCRHGSEDERNKTKGLKESLFTPKVKNNRCNGTQVKSSSGKECFTKILEEKNSFSKSSPNSSYPKELITPKRDCSIRQKLNFDLSQSDKHPRISKIPCLMQNLEDFSPLSKISTATAKMKRMPDYEDTQSQKKNNYSKNEQVKMKNADESFPIINACKKEEESLFTTYLSDEEEENLISTYLCKEEQDTLFAIHLSEEEQELSSFIEEMLYVPDNSKASISQNENNVMPTRNEDLLASNISLLSCKSFDTFKSIDCTSTSSGELNDGFKVGDKNIVFHREDSCIGKELNQVIDRERKVMRDEKEDQFNVENCCLEDKSPDVVKNEKTVSKGRKKRIKVRHFMILFFLNTLLFWLLFWLGQKLLEEIEH